MPLPDRTVLQKENLIFCIRLSGDESTLDHVR